MSIFKKFRRKNQDSSQPHDANEAGIPEEDTPQGGLGYQPPTNLTLQHHTAEQPPAGPPPLGAPPTLGGATLFAGLQLAPATTVVVQLSEQSGVNQLNNEQSSGLGASSETQPSEGGSAFSFISTSGGGDLGDGLGGGVAAGHKEEEESRTQGSAFSFMNMEQTSETLQAAKEEGTVSEVGNHEEASLTTQSAFSFLQGPTEGQKDQEGLGLSAAGGDQVDHDTPKDGASGDLTSLDVPTSSSAFSFLHTNTSEEKPVVVVDQEPSLLLSFGMDAPSPTTAAEPEQPGAKRKESAPIAEQPRVSSTAPTSTTPTKPTGRGVSIRNFLGFGRNTKKQATPPTESPEHSSRGSVTPPTSTANPSSVQDVVEPTTPHTKEASPKEGGKEEVPRPSPLQEGVEQEHQPQADATPLPPTLSALLMGNATPSATPAAALTPKKWALPAKGASVSTPMGAAEAPGEEAAPLPLQPLVPSKPVAAPPTAKAPPISRQVPMTQKKKKRKAVRPGQGREEEDTEGGGTKDVDTQSLESESSTIDGKGATEGLEDTGMVEVAGPLQHLVDLEPAASDAPQVTPSAPITPPAPSTVLIEDLLVKPSDARSKAEEATKGPPKKDSIPSGLRAAYQLDKAIAPSTSVVSDERGKGEALDQRVQDSSEAPPPKDARSDAVKGNPSITKAVQSGAEKLSVTLRNSESELAKIRSDQKSVQQKYMEVLDGHLAATKKRIQTRLHLEDLKAKEAQALAEENYELADELSRELESAAHSQEWVMATAFQTAIKEWVQSWSKLISTEVSLQKTLETNLSVIKEEQSKVLVVLEREFSQQFSREKTKLKTLEDKVERERGHVALDKEHLEKSEALLKEDLDSQCSSVVATKQKLQAQREEVLGEIAALEAKLRELRGQERRIAEAIQTEQEKIESIHRELAGEQAHLAEQRRELDKREAEMKKDEVLLNQMRTAYEASTEKKEAEKRGVLASIQTIEAIKADGDSRATGLHKFLEESGTLIRGDTGAMLKPSTELQSLQDRYLAREKALKDASSQVFQLQSGISSLKNKMAETERQLPALEEAKKAAVNARQFKEAAKISTEIKQLGADIEEYKNKVVEKEGQLSARKKEQESCELGIASLKAELDAMQRKEDLVHIKDLVKMSESQKGRVEKCSSSPSLLCVLQYWSLLHELLAQDLCAKHNLDIATFKSSDEKVPTSPTHDVKPEATVINDPIGAVDYQVTANLEERTSDELTPDTSADNSAAVEVLNGKIREVEALIAQACETENFELAAQLDEQLQELKKSLQGILRH